MFFFSFLRKVFFLPVVAFGMILKLSAFSGQHSADLLLKSQAPADSTKPSAESRTLSASLLLARRLLLGDRGTARAFACARVRVRALAAHGEPAAVAQA